MKLQVHFHYSDTSYKPCIPILRASNVGAHSPHNWDFLKAIERRSLSRVKKRQPPMKPVVDTGSANG